MARIRVSGLIVTVMAILCLRSLPVLVSGRECTSIDVRNNLASLNQLDGCTVIKGYLMIVLLAKNISVNDYSNITFPELREITDFFIMYDVKGLTSFKKLLPNLTVIRGRRLFLNYALAVSNMPDLAAFEFKSLVAIQRGHVFIGSCPKLCFLKKVNWDRLTLSPGENHIIPMTDVTCAPSDCAGCESEYCWSNMVCQKFENDNVVNLALGCLHCHPECLGGCYNTTNAGCVVCKGISDHGICVSECPSNLYYSEHHQRCYTKAECGSVRGYVIGNKCNRNCPSGYISSRKVTECIKCASGCIKTCHPPDGYGAFVVFNLADADMWKGCHRLNGNLYIEIRNVVDENELVKAFESVREIQGHIKVVRSPNLKSLAFLRNLERIEGNPLENKTFALVIYKNDRLEELWTPPIGKTVEFINGGIYTYSNYKLCNKVVQEFTARIVHDKDKDLVQLNDLEVLCSTAKLNIAITSVDQNSATLSWARNQTADEVEIIYREAKYNNHEQSELDDHVCERINWNRELLFSKGIPHNSSHFSYVVTGLKAMTKYEVLVKTFQENSDYSARSVIERLNTLPDYPTAPKLKTLEKTRDSITLGWVNIFPKTEAVNYYLLEHFEHSVDLETLDSRNFCERPTVIYGVSPLEDYDDCCQRMQQQRLDEEFRRDIENMFPCTVRTRENCQGMIKYGLRENTDRIDGVFETYTLHGLKPSTMYTFYFYACNHIGCGAYSMYNDKTNFSVEADEVDKVEACRMPDTNEYHLSFHEPKHPNGAIVSYNIHFQDVDSLDIYRGQLNCVTRKQHELAGFRFSILLNSSFTQAAVRTSSLAGSVLSKWFTIKVCDRPASSHGMSATGVFFLLCFIAALVAGGWVGYRRKLWTHIRNYRWRRPEETAVVRYEDCEVLVATFNAATLQNSPDD